jgi:hypothetical protein
LLYIYCFFPLFSLVDPEAADAPVIDYVVDNDPLLARATRQAPPFDHPDIAHSILS